VSDWFWICGASPFQLAQLTIRANSREKILVSLSFEDHPSANIGTGIEMVAESLKRLAN
jgi:hypothetical protein